MSPLRILYLNPGAELGGAETSLTDLLSGIRRRRPDWKLHLLTGSEGPLLNEAQKLGVETSVLPLPEQLARAGDSGLTQPGSRLRAMRRLCGGAWAFHRYGRLLAETVARLDPSIVHCTGLKMQLLAALYIGRSRRIIWHIHDYVSWRPVARKLLRLAAPKVRGALVNSESVGADLTQSCPGVAWTECLYNAVDVEDLGGQPAVDLDEAAKAPAAPPGTVRIGLVATYARWKGHLTYLDALAQLPRDLCWRAYVVGGPIYQTDGSQFRAGELQDEIDRRNLAGRVFLTGFLRGRGGIMRSLDIVVHASTKPEPFGMVIVEAMAMERPVIVSYAGGARELFEDEVNGLGHTPGDATHLSQQLARLLRSPEERTRLGKAGRRHARERFSRARQSEQLSACYERLMMEHADS
jgi:glycosyltransferase involved in cell wall biosynthesis